MFVFILTTSGNGLPTFVMLLRFKHMLRHGNKRDTLDDLVAVKSNTNVMGTYFLFDCNKTVKGTYFVFD